VNESKETRDYGCLLTRTVRCALPLLPSGLEFVLSNELESRRLGIVSEIKNGGKKRYFSELILRRSLMHCSLKMLKEWFSCLK